MDDMESVDKKENFYSSLRLTKYGLGVRATSFVSFLAWTGMILATLGLLFSAQLLVLPTFVLNLRQDQINRFSLICYTGGVLGALVSSSWLALHMVLRKRNVQRDFQSVQRILKAKCYISGGIEIIFNVVGIVAVFVFLAETQNYYELDSGLNVYGAVFVLILYLISSSCMIHGVRKDANSYINVYILFKIIYALAAFTFSVSSLSILSTSGIMCVLFVLSMMILFVLFVYCNGDLVVLYNVNHHSRSKMYIKNLEFINQAFREDDKKIQA